MLNWVKILLFLVWTIVYQCILIIEKDILVFDKGPTDGLDDITVTTEANYFVNITKFQKGICLSLLYNAANSFLYAKGLNIRHFKVNNSEIK